MITAMAQMIELFDQILGIQKMVTDRPNSRDRLLRYDSLYINVQHNCAVYKREFTWNFIENGGAHKAHIELSIW